MDKLYSQACWHWPARRSTRRRKLEIAEKDRRNATDFDGCSVKLVNFLDSGVEGSVRSVSRSWQFDIFRRLCSTLRFQAISSTTPVFQWDSISFLDAFVILQSRLVILMLSSLAGRTMNNTCIQMRFHVRKVICPWTSPLNVGWCWMCWTISKRLYKLTQTITYQYIEIYRIYKWSHIGSCIPMTWAKGPCMSMHTGKHARIPHANIHTETYHTCTQFQRSPCLPRCQVEWYEKWSIVMEIACIKIIKRHWYRIHTLRYKLHSIVLLCVALRYISNHLYILCTNACSHLWGHTNLVQMLIPLASILKLPRDVKLMTVGPWEGRCTLRVCRFPFDSVEASLL